MRIVIVPVLNEHWDYKIFIGQPTLFEVGVIHRGEKELKIKLRDPTPYSAVEPMIGLLRHRLMNNITPDVLDLEIDE